MHNKIISSVYRKDTELFKKYIEGSGKNHINTPNKVGWTALIIAVSKGYKELVELILAHGGRKDIPDKNGITPLEEARRKGYTDIVKLLA